jgi:signal transduction histidine kinase
MMNKEKNIEWLVRKALERSAIPATVRVAVQVDLADRQVQVDPEGVIRLLGELILNACEAMPGGGDLSLTVTGDAGWVTLTIADQGCGMDPEALDQLFTPFYSTKPPGEGMGLGLPTAYAAVRGQGGSLTVASNADPSQGPTGTQVRITLPRRPPRQQIQRPVILHDD